MYALLEQHRRRYLQKACEDKRVLQGLQGACKINAGRPAERMPAAR